MEDRRLVFVFAGQGGQFAGMARKLLAEDAVFRAEVERFDRCYRKISGESVIDDLLADAEQSRINLTIASQPTIFALQIGLVARWREWGVVPDAVMGHSFGETAAAYTAGALTLEDAARIVYHRARLSNRGSGHGSVYAIGKSPAAQQKVFAERGEYALDIAAINGQAMVNVAGPADALERLADWLKSQEPDTFVRRLQLDYAPHCRLLDGIRAEFEASIAGIATGPLRIPMISTVNGRALARGELAADYWWQNVRQPVRFTDALQSALQSGYRVFLEIGPHTNISALTRAPQTHRGEHFPACGDSQTERRRRRNSWGSRNAPKEVGPRAAPGRRIHRGWNPPAGRRESRRWLPCAGASRYGGADRCFRPRRPPLFRELSRFRPVRPRT
jgi:acyl transferase domain-containing protein